MCVSPWKARSWITPPYRQRVEDVMGMTESTESTIGKAARDVTRTGDDGAKQSRSKRGTKKRRMLWTALTLLLLGSFVSTAALAGPVNGSLSVPNGFKAVSPSEGPAAFYWQQWNGVLPPEEDQFDPARHLAVVLVGKGEGAGDQTYRLYGGDFEHDTMVARVGSTLRIQNTDGCSHDLYAEGVAGFEALATGPGNARTQALPAAGQFLIKDATYAHVTGYLHVLPDLIAVAEVNSQGRYSFSNVAPGSYTLKVLYRDKEAASQEVTVDGSRTLSIDALALKLSAQ